MKPIQLRQHILPIYLAVILLVITSLEAIVILNIVIPLLIISIGIHINHKTIGIIGIFLFYLLSIPQYQITTIDDPLRIYGMVFLILLPSILLLSQILRQQYIIEIMQVFNTRKKPILLSIFSGIFVLFLFYIFPLFIGGEIFFSNHLINNQIMLFAGLSLLLFTPMLIKQKHI